MKCPAAIAEVLTEILHVALLRIRARGWEQNAEACAAEADHVHNLPALLQNYSEEALHYYMDFERVSFAKKCATVGRFAELWQCLDAVSERHAATQQ